MATIEVTAKICTKCGDNPATEKHQWCKECKAKYQQEWRDKREEMEVAKAFAQGAESMRHVLVREFHRHGLGMMYAVEVAKYIALVAPPRYGEQPQPAPGPQQIKTEPQNAV